MNSKEKSHEKMVLDCFLKAMGPRMSTFLRKEGIESLEEFLAIETGALITREKCGESFALYLRNWQKILKDGATIKLSCLKENQFGQQNKGEPIETISFEEALLEYVKGIFSFANLPLTDSLRFKSNTLLSEADFYIDESYFPARANNLFERMGLETLQDIVTNEHLITRATVGIGESTERLIKIGVRAQLYRDLNSSPMERENLCYLSSAPESHNEDRVVIADPRAKEQARMFFWLGLPGLDIRSKNVLKALNIDSVNGLLTLDKEVLLECQNCGVLTARRILDFKGQVIGFTNRIKEQQACSGQPREPVSKEVRKYLVQHAFSTVIDELDERSKGILESLHVNTPGALFSLTSDALLKYENCGRLTADRILSARRTYMSTFYEAMNLFLTPRDSGGGWNAVSDKVAWLDSWLEVLAKSHRAKLAFKLRMGLMGEKALTLDEVGQRVGVSRERVRQYVKAIEKKAMSFRSQSKLRVLFRGICSTLASHGGVLNFKELAAALWNDSYSKSVFKYSEPLFRLFARMDSWLATGLSIEQDRYVVLGTMKNVLDLNGHEVYELFKENSDDFRDDETWTIDLNQAKLLLTLMLNEKTESHEIRSVSKSFATLAVERSNPKLKIRGERIYSERYWKMKFGSQKEFVETILLSRRCPIHIDIITKELKRWRPNSNNWNPLRILTKSNSEALLWGRGFYIHRDFVKVPKQLMTEIESWIVQRLNMDVPFLYVNAAYDEFKERCIHHDIPCEAALYSCLRESENPTLLYPRYPAVYLKRRYSPDVDHSKEGAIEQYLRSIGGIVSKQEFLKYWIGQVGMRDYQVGQVVANSANIVRTSEWGYIHVDNLEYDLRALKGLAKVAEEIVSKEGHCSADRLYSENAVLCAIIGVKSPQALYSLLRSHMCDQLLLRRYPKIETLDSRSEKRTIGHYIVDFIRLKERPCPYSELIEQFESKRGYSRAHVYNIVHNPNISLYLPGCVIHFDTLGWGPVRQRQLEMLASGVCTLADNSGIPYGKVDNLIGSSHLPELPKHLNWSDAMILHLLQKEGNFRSIGNMRKIFVPTKSKHNISNISELCTVLLEKDNRELVPREEFECFLIKEGIIGNALTAFMVKESRIVLTKDYVFLKDD